MNDQKRKTILLVEDEMIIAMTERMNLEKYGYNVIEANTGEEAIKTVDEIQFIDLILMDIDLGSGMNGPDTAVQILKIREVPIVFLTSHNEKEVVDKVESITNYGYVIKNSGKFVLIQTLKGALRLFEANQKIAKELIERKRADEYIKNLSIERESLLKEVNHREQFHTIIQTLPDIIYKINIDGLFTYINNAVSLLGYTPEELLGKHFRIMLNEQDIEKISRDLIVPKYTDDLSKITEQPKLFDERRTGNRITRNLRLNIKHRNAIKEIAGDIISVGVWEQNKSGVTEYSGTIGVIRNIDEVDLGNHALILTENHYRTLISNLTEIILIIAVDGTILFATNSSKNSLGYDPFVILGENIYSYIHQEDAGQLSSRIWLLTAEPVDESKFSLRMINSSKEWLYFKIQMMKIADNNKQTSCLIINAIDITEQANLLKDLRNLLTQKELILKEVHHRIKNNMSTMISLLSLQSMTLKDTTTIAVLEEAGNRIQSMMLLYDKLYQSPNFNEMSVKEYLPELVDQIIENFPNFGVVKIVKNIDDFLLESNRLLTLGIIINELLTNIMKYAFVDRIDGIITISAALLENIVIIIIQDNGNGIPESIDFENSSGFGLMLVGMQTKQLHGTIRIERENGTRIILEFEK